MFSRRSFAGGLGALGIGACSSESGVDSRVIFSSDSHASDYPTVMATREMGRLLKERTEGRLGIKVFQGGQLGSERDTMEIMTMGGIDMGRINIAPFNAIAPLSIVPVLPFLFKDVAHSRRVFDGAPGRKVLDSFEQYGIKGLVYYDCGSRNFYGSRGPIKTPDDLAGMKLRVQNSDVSVAMIDALGADATPMYIGEVYQSLVQGVIDGGENNWPTYFTERHHEVAPYFTRSQHVMTPDMMVMSMHRWNSLSEDDRVVLMECAEASVLYMRELWDAKVLASQEAALAAGVQMNDVDDITQFSDLMRPIWDRFATSNDQKQLIEEIEAMRDVET